MTNRARTVAALVLALGGCASAPQTYDAQGREAYTVNCSGWARSWAMCERRLGSCAARVTTRSLRSRVSRSSSVVF